MKKYILGLVFAVMVPFTMAYAATPTLSVTGSGDNNNVTVRVTGGEINAPVVLFYNGLTGGNVQQITIGTTDMSGNFTGTVSTSGVGINFNTPVYVQVGGYQSQSVNWPYNAATTTTGTAGGLTFSPGVPSFALGQNGTITLSGGSGGYYISSNSNPNFTTASINGNTLTVNGLQTGTSNITVCSFSGSCGVISVNFGSTTATSTTGSVTGVTGSPTLSQGFINVSQGGQNSITLSGGTTPYTIIVPTGSGISTTLVGNTLYINGNIATPGTATIQVCSASTSTVSSGACTPVTVNILGQGQVATMTVPTGTANMVSFVIPMTVGQTMRLSLLGGSGSYFLQSPATSPVTANINGALLTLMGTALGQATYNVCSTGATTMCTPVSVMVSAATFPNTGTGGGYFFENDLSMGQTNQDVMELQNRLADEGYFNATATGYFGPITEAAVRAYQNAHGISAVGVVGPLTRAALNQ